MKMMKRALALLLCVVMVVGYVPATVFAADGGVSAQANDDPIYVLAGGDFQAGDNGQGDHYYSRINMGNILDKIKEKYSTMNGFIFVGDYDGDTHNDSNANAGVAAMMEEVSERFNTLNHDNSYLIEGNHETGAVSGIDATGGYDCDGYAVYLINETDFCERQEGKSAQIQTVANNLKTWLNNKIGEGYDAPIFVATHTPLGYTTRTYTNGDSLYGKYVFDVLNDAAANGLNIIFMHGHDHAYGADNYLGGEAIYLPKGDKINICVPGDKTAWTEETLNFTYMNAGYVGYYNENYYDVNSYEAEKLTMTVFKIEDNQVTVERWSKDGLYNLKSKGREGFYSNASTCSAIGLSYNETVYASPQTITLAEATDYGSTIGSYVGVTPSFTDDVTTDNKGWVELIAPVPGKDAVPGTPASTKYVYTLDTDGTVTDKENAAQGYLIVGSGNNNNYAMTDSLGATGVTITNNTITLDAQPNYEWWITADGKITDGTNYLKFTGTYQNYQASGSVSVTTNASEATSWDISHSNNGAYSVSYTYSYGSWVTRETTYYLRYNNNTFSVTNSPSTVRLFSGTEVTTPATEGTPATPGTNGTYGKIVGNLTYNATVGMTADEAMALVKAGIDGYYYDAMSTPGSSVTGTKVEDSVLTWEWVDTFDGNTAGDYEVAIKYGDFLLGTAEVVVPATTTYYIAEGNGLYLVDMNTTEANALAAVKDGVTVYSATDTQGNNKTAISDDEVEWVWKDTYNGADSGPYTVEILVDGTSLGTVEVKVDVKYETGLEEDWTYIGETEGSGGTTTVTYTLDTNGIDTGSSNKYIIVARDQAYLLNAGSAVAVTISSDGKTATTNTRDYEYYFTGATSGLITRDGSNTLYQQNWGIHTGYIEDSNLDRFTNLNNGYYRIYDGDGTARSLYYNGSAWTVTSENHTSSTYSVRLYKYTSSETVGGTPGGPIYALLEGNTVYTVTQGSSATKALAAVKAGITGYLASDANGTNKTELADSDLTWKWKNTFNGNATGSYWVEISYKGKVLGIVEVKVEPGVVNNYPEYPNEGAVHVNKTATGIDFQSSGIAQIELSASGVPIKKGADVIIMLDTSSSMTSHTVTGSSKTRAQVLEESLKNLIADFKTPGDDGELLDIRVAIADFNGFYGENHNASGTPYDRDAADMMSDDIYYNANSEAKIYTGDGSLGAGAFIPVEDLANSYTLNYTSGTNYDYAFDAIYQMGTAIKEANGSEDRDLYVIFMSDGAAMQWNYYHSQGASSLWNNWITGAWTSNQLSLNCNTHAYYYDEVDHNGDGMRNEHRMANAVKGDPAQQYEVIRKTNTLGTATGEANMYMVPGLGAKLFTISFDATADDKVTEESMDKSIASLASPQTGSTQYYYKVTTADELDSAFHVIGAEIAYAASNARFVDQMGDNFNLQMTPIVDYNGDAILDENGAPILPSIEIISYDIYTRQDYLNGKCTIDQIGNRKGTHTVLETVTFTSTKNDDGTYTVTGVYSDQIDDGKTNILADGTQAGYVKGVIYAKTFIYNTNITDVAVNGVNIPTGKTTNGTTTGSTNVLPSETFYWKMGTVQTSELAMRYYVYLDGSMEGTKEAGSYKTNEFAVLYYDNYLGNPCYKDTVSPTVAWKSANVSYAFYLVNEKGEIIVNQTTGQTGSFANKIAVTNPVVYEEILLNNTDQVQSIDVAAISDDVLPKYYDLYDAGAVYEIRINSDATGEWVITKGDVAAYTTYVTNYTLGTAYSNAPREGNEGYDYTHTIVWFAVVWSVQAHPDSVVVDYGLPVDISVLTNDMFGDYGKLAGVGAYSGSLNLDGHDTTLASGFGSSYTGTYGDAEVLKDEKGNAIGKIRYTLNTMSMNGYEKFAYAVSYSDTSSGADANKNGYYYDTITVIPATTIYYEESFLTFTGSNTKWEEEGTAIEGATQAEDRPGKYSLTDANNIYGYDSVNKGMATYSMGTAKKVHVDADSYATASFTFTGTGFDVISMTSADTGLLVVQVYEHGTTNVVKSFSVDTYYGYKQDAEGNWVLNPDATGSIYQVPVIQIENLTYDQYDVVLTAAYADVLDNKPATEGFDLYLDAIRIYDPANDGAVDGSDDTTIEDAYKADGEGWPSYIELRDKIIEAGSFDNVANDALTDDMEGLVFIDGDASVGNAQLSDYVNYGPNNEVYLAPGQRVAFILNTPASIDQIHIGLKSADGAKVTYTITNIAQNADTENKVTVGQWYNARTNTLDTTTDMYYDLTGWKSDIIVISNTGDRYGTDGILSITNIKSTYTSDPNGIPEATEPEAQTVSVMSLRAAAEDAEVTGETSLYMTPAAAALTLRTLNTMYLPEVFEPEQMEVSVNRDHVMEGDKVKVTVKTSDDVAYITVNGETVTKYRANRRTGERTWTVTLKAEEAGQLDIEVVAYDAEDLASDPVTEIVTVEAKKDPKQVAKEILKGLLGRFFN